MTKIALGPLSDVVRPFGSSLLVAAAIGGLSLARSHDVNHPTSLRSGVTQTAGRGVTRSAKESSDAFG